MSLSSENVTETEVVEGLAEEGLNATPDAVAAITSHDDPAAAVRRLAATCDSVVVTREDVRGALEKRTSETASSSPKGTDADTGDTLSDTRTDTDTDTGGTRPDASPSASSSSSTSASSSQVPSQSSSSPSSKATTGVRTPSEVEVENDITGESTCTGDYSDFVGYFRDRFNRLSKKLRSRIQPRSIESAASAGKDVALVGMVNEVRTTSSDRDNRLVEIEDPTGTIRLLFSEDLVDTAETLVVDEVIGVEGRLSDDAGMVFVNDVHFPEVPPRREPNVASREVSAVLVSDVHVGSDTFVGDHGISSPTGSRDRRTLSTCSLRATSSRVSVSIPDRTKNSKSLTCTTSTPLAPRGSRSCPTM